MSEPTETAGWRADSAVDHDKKAVGRLVAGIGDAMGDVGRIASRLAGLEGDAGLAARHVEGAGQRGEVFEGAMRMRIAVEPAAGSDADLVPFDLTGKSRGRQNPRAGTNRRRFGFRAYARPK